MNAKTKNKKLRLTILKRITMLKKLIQRAEIVYCINYDQLDVKQVYQWHLENSRRLNEVDRLKDCLNKAG